MDPVEQLKEEHVHIMRGVKLLEQIAKMSVDNSLPLENAKNLLNFFKNYADLGHHAKEEDILFKILYAKDESLKSDTSPLGILTEQHVEGRKLVGKLNELNSEFDLFAQDYSFLIRRHIDIEDELFPTMAEDYLTEDDLKVLTTQFRKVDEEKEINQFLKILDTVEFSL